SVCEDAGSRKHGERSYDPAVVKVDRCALRSGRNDTVAEAHARVAGAIAELHRHLRVSLKSAAQNDAGDDRLAEPPHECGAASGYGRGCDPVSVHGGLDRERLDLAFRKGHVAALSGVASAEQ